MLRKLAVPMVDLVKKLGEDDDNEPVAAPSPFVPESPLNFPMLLFAAASSVCESSSVLRPATRRVSAEPGVGQAAGPSGSVPSVGADPSSAFDPMQCFETDSE